jgi:hypothetical protein
MRGIGARAGHQDVDAAVTLQNLLHGCFDGVLVGHVQQQSLCTAHGLQRRQSAGVGGGVAARNHHMSTGLGQLRGASQPNATAPTGDPRDLAVK